MAAVRFSLKTKALGFIVLVTLIPGAFVMWTLLQSITRASDDVEARALDQTAVLIRQELLTSVSAKAEVYDLTLINLISSLDALKDVVAGSEDPSSALTEFSYRHRLASSVYLIDPEGTMISVPAAEKESWLPQELPSEFAFMDGDKRAFTGRWAGPYRDPKTSLDIMTYALPLWGEEDGVRPTIVAFDVTVDNLLNEVTDIDPSESSYVFIVRNDGRFVTASQELFGDLALSEDAANVLSSPYAERLGLRDIIAARDERRGAFDLPELADGERKMVVYANIPSFGARIFVTTPLDEVLQVQREKAAALQRAVERIVFSGVLVLLALAVLIAIASFVFIDKAIIGPIRHLMRGIDRLERNEFSSETEVSVISGDEIGLLASRFNAMAGRLRELYAGLERKVAERTAEIRRTLSELERLNRLMVNRELRMRELKDENDRLRKDRGA